MWLYNSLWIVLAFSTNSFHLLLSWTRVFQFGTFDFCISYLTSSSQRTFGLPIWPSWNGFPGVYCLDHSCFLHPFDVTKPSQSLWSNEVYCVLVFYYFIQFLVGFNSPKTIFIGYIYVIIKLKTNKLHYFYFNILFQYAVPCISYYFLLWPTNAQLFHKLSHSYVFRHYRVIVRKLIINALPSYTNISNAAVGNSLYYKLYYQQLHLKYFV